MRSLFVAAFVANVSLAASPADIPAPLKEWAPWVLHNEREATCPFLQGTEGRECAWPARLQLTLDEKGGHFTQGFKVYGREAWLPLPGAERRWPQNVKVDGKPAIVVASEARPTVLVPPGEHSVTGDFQWDSMPEALEIPAETGLLALSLKGQAVPQPNRDGEGRVFLQRETTQEETDHLEVDVHRLVTDEIPLTITTRVALKVSGRSREVMLGRALPEKFVPMSLTGSLPVRIENDGRLRVQVRPGNWLLELTARGEGAMAAIKRPQPDGPWGENEIWVFDARPSLRQVLIEGVNAVDPTQTTLPPEWRSYPAYAVELDEEFKLTERRRGDSDPAPDVLNLNRTLWLDFNGKGYTVSDQVHGQLHRSWRLDVEPGTELGRVVASGADQSITREAGGKAGVELRQGALGLEADSRIVSDNGDISAVSWDADFNSVSATLNVPPGWRLISARGADSVPGTWFNQWSLLDIFLVLIIAVAMARLFGIKWGVLAAVTLGLSWLEDDVPQYMWLVVLVAEALFRVLPVGAFKTLLKLTRLAAVAILSLIFVAFAVQHIRQGMYPSLARNTQLGGVKGYTEYFSENSLVYSRSSAGEQGYANIDGVNGNAYDEENLRGAIGSLGGKGNDWQANNAPVQAQTKQQGQKKRSYDVRDFDKNATVQTGPGLPRWSWEQVNITFSGPVQRDQRLSFFFLGPAANFVLAFVRVILLALLLLLVMGFPGNFWPKFLKAAKAAAPAAGVLLALLSTQVLAQTTPSPDMLEQLRQRLIEKPDCAPNCASSPRLLLEATPKVLRLRLEVLSGAETAIPLPGSATQWVPDTVLLDGKPAGAMLRQPDGSLWIAVSEGAHQVQLEGALPGRDTVQIALPLRAYRVEAKLEGWTLDGLHEDGVADENLQLSRKATNEKKEEGGALQVGTLPPFVRVERTLILGLQWTVETMVTRLTPTGSAVVLEVPLLAGESVTSSDVRVVGGKALVNMPAAATTLSWTSVLDSKAPIALTAPSSVPWVEVWRLDVSPVWHVGLSGIPVVHQQDASGARLPEWHPWPGENVTIDVARPEALRGQTMTIDQSSLTVSPGARATSVTFTANLRSSRGGLHAFTLPEGAALQNVTINGVQQPIRQEGRTVSIPLIPGSQSIVLEWRETEGMAFSWRTPQFDIGTPTVNADVEVRVPNDRWVLFVRGPGLGPAVLFWSFLLVLLAVSIALARTQYTPLSTVKWVLLALGLSQVPVVAIGFVFAWLLFLGWREKVDLTPGWFQLRQLAVAGVTFIALCILGVSVYEGLLGQPEMQVGGNGSSAFLLRWFLDRTTNEFPQATVISVPMLVYRGAMLAWSLWMALSLVSWLKWGWKAFSTFGLWKAMPPAKKNPPPAPAPKTEG